MSRWWRDYRELWIVLTAALVAIAVPGPGRWLTDHHGVDLALAALVAVTALAIPSGAAAALSRDRTRLLVVLVATAAVLPALGWVASRLVADQVLRRGVWALGVAPAEVASVATVGVAGGETAAASGLLIGSTLLTVVLAGPVLGLLGGSAGVDVGAVLVNLALVIAAPLVVGLAVRNRVARGPTRDHLETVAPVVLVSLLVYLVASEVRFTRSYVGVVGALVVFLVGSTALGWAFGRGAARPLATAVGLTTAMRDFAIAAGIATAAFGAASAGPLGIYGVLVIPWGLAIAGAQRRRSPA
jgi:predicted Na+-dependent transporter